MAALDSALRSQLETTVKKARRIAERAATAARTALDITAATAPANMDDTRRALRRHLRARGRMLGDERAANGSQPMDHLVHEVAYEHWHQMLFARFLAENNLLMHHDGVPVTLDDCAELIEEDPKGCFDAKTAPQLAAHYATAMLPDIFRPHDPVLQLRFAVNDQQELEGLLNALPAAVFTAEDSLGWVYQFWQAEAKERINKSEVKIGADELPAVTQLFTEPYMVQFLLHNSIGAWWAGKKLTAEHLANAASEQELRDLLRAQFTVADYHFTYLRFVRDEEGGPWRPAAGTFDGWPDTLAEFTALDPCCGSGHFLVALLNLLARLRMADEGLSAREAVDAVLTQNLHGLEIDLRCTQIAVFAVALAAWTFPGDEGFRALPKSEIACCGLHVSGEREEWMALADGVADFHERTRLQEGMGRIWDTFSQAPTLGSLVNPGSSNEQNSFLSAGWDEVGPVLSGALAEGILFEDDARGEIGLAAQGLAHSASLLCDTYDLVLTNVPYLGRLQQNSQLRDWIDLHHPRSKADLSTVFLERSLCFASPKGTVLLVTPQNWLNLKSYVGTREYLLENCSIFMLSTLGEEAWQSFGKRGPRATLIGFSAGRPCEKSITSTVDCTDLLEIYEKQEALTVRSLERVPQSSYAKNPDYRITMRDVSAAHLLDECASSLQGTSTGDTPRFTRYVWESAKVTWDFLQGTPDGQHPFSGRREVVDWNGVAGFTQSAVRGTDAFGKRGLAVRQMRSLFIAYYDGSRFDNNTAVIIPEDPALLTAMQCYLASQKYTEDVRAIDQKVNVTNASLVKVPFDAEDHAEVASSTYPNGLPRPYTNDPTQWIFHGHPCASVIWDEQSKWTAHGPTRNDASVLHISMARLLGYRWPAELDPDMELATEQRAVVDRCEALLPYADNDGIVCLPAVCGEDTAADRLTRLLAAAYGNGWSPGVLTKLLAHDKAKNLDAWLRDKFFAGHVALFQNRPFLWHIWDGRKDGFHAVVNYHKLDQRLLERLIHTYLQEWLDRQEADTTAGVAGADLRLAAAQELREKLLAIHTGEPPYDLFIRWKPLHEQPIGWNPDLDDGVRLNIRPWIEAGVLRTNLSTKIKYTKDRGKDPEGSPWGSERRNDRHFTIADKQAAQAQVGVNT